jgi:hypothetical protein
MSQELEQYLTAALKKLDVVYDQIIKTQGYSAETEKVKMLTELLKEQSQNEDTHYTTRTSR